MMSETTKSRKPWFMLVLAAAVLTVAGSLWFRPTTARIVAPSPSVRPWNRLPAVELSFDQLGLKDSKGDWVRINGLRVEKTTADLKDHTVAVSRVAVDQLVLMHRPEYAARETVATTRPQEPDPAISPWGLNLESIDIRDLVMMPGFTGLKETMRLSIEGRFDWRGGGAYQGQMRFWLQEPFKAAGSITVRSGGEQGEPVAFDVTLDTDKDTLRAVGRLVRDRWLEFEMHGRLGRLTLSGNVALENLRDIPSIAGLLAVRLSPSADGKTEESGLADKWLPEGAGLMWLAAAADANGRQNIEAQIKAAPIAGADFRAEKLTLAGGIRDLFGERPEAWFETVLETGARGDHRLDRAVLRAETMARDDSQPLAEPLAGLTGFEALAGYAQRLRSVLSPILFSGHAAGWLHGLDVRMAVEGQAQGALGKDGNLDLWIDSLEGVAGEMDLELEQRLIFQWCPEGFSLKPFRLRAGTAQIEAQTCMSPTRVDGRIQWSHMPLDRVPFMAERKLGADVAGSLTLQGTPDYPQWRMEIEALNPRMRGVPAPPELFQHLTIRMSDVADGISLTAAAGTADIRRMALETLLPWRLRLRPAPALEPVDQPRLKGSVAAEMPLNILADLLLPDDTRRIDGILQAGLQWDGTIQDPGFKGLVAVRDAGFHDLLMGTILRDIQIVLRGDRQGVVIETAEASDHGNGRVSLQGKLDLWPWGLWRHDIRLDLRRMRVVERDDITAEVSGELALRGDRKASMLQGQIRLAPVEIRLPERLPSMVPALPIRKPSDTGHAPAARQPLLPQVAIDVSLHAPNRVFVRNRAIDTEWQGTLDLGGTLEQLSVEGVLEVIHGRFMVLGRRFLVDQGLIRFPGYPVIPQFDAVAETKAGAITARLRLSGTPQHSKWELSSVPDMPEDEILAHIFFNRSTGNLTPGQALRLAQAAEALAGGGRLTDVLDHGRRALRVDRIDYVEGQTPDDPARVSIGKYLGSRGFVDFEQEVSGGDSGRVVISVDFKPAISLETTIDTDGERGIGLRWRYDY